MPAVDILGRTIQEFAGAFSSDGANIRFVDSFDSTVGALLQQLGYQYTQPITKLYELGTSFVYYVAGRPRGDATAASVIGPKQTAWTFYQIYGDVCNGDVNNLWLSLGVSCDGALQSDPFELVMSGVVLQTLAGNVRSEDMVIGEQLQMTFVSLEWA